MYVRVNHFHLRYFYKSIDNASQNNYEHFFLLIFLFWPPIPSMWSLILPFHLHPPHTGQKYGQITGRGKKMIEGDKKGGKCIFFPPLVKSKKRFKIFPLRRAPPHNKFHWGKKLNHEEGGGAKI